MSGWGCRNLSASPIFYGKYSNENNGTSQSLHDPHFYFHWRRRTGNLLPKDTFEIWGGLGHAGEGETSIAYHLLPDWCEPELATCVVPDLPDEVEIKSDKQHCY